MAGPSEDTLSQAGQALRLQRERRAVPAPGARKAAGKLGKRLANIAVADAAILIAALVIGWIVPIGMGGFLLMIAALIVATVALAIFPREPVVRLEQLPEAPLKLLPQRTASWLHTQRPALPPAARSLVDGIGVRLETLSPQLAGLDEREPAAAEIRKLVGEQLPELLKGYERVPAPLRGVARNGRTPDQQLADGLAVIEQEIGEMSTQLAQGDLDNLQTRQRFLEIRYRDDGQG
ncbi:hypothetical protein [Sphingomonas aracearum]|uniref:Uncharacterized protein n=1 Tax=Sphingomonas aracearum TaxID=2283317 RepID=A0A369VXS1_9SPHN|nr:hypothetical protein [Sphingomonas aracearum]RDE07184.1 hypothetical protein DVW87_05970 [Sphingomonas aracearum]